MFGMWAIVSAPLVLYGNFDIIFDHFPRLSQLYATRAVYTLYFHLVPVLIGF